jgi:hypothetical protein
MSGHHGYLAVWLLNCCWPSPTQRFLDPSAKGLMTKLHCLTALGAFISCSVRQSVKLLLVFASIVIPGFHLLKIHDKDCYSPLDRYVFRNGASSSTKEVSMFLCRRYVCCTVVLARVYLRCHGVQVTMDSVHLCHCTSRAVSFHMVTKNDSRISFIAEITSVWTSKKLF